MKEVMSKLTKEEMDDLKEYLIEKDELDVISKSLHAFKNEKERLSTIPFQNKPFSTTNISWFYESQKNKGLLTFLETSISYMLLLIGISLITPLKNSLDALVEESNMILLIGLLMLLTLLIYYLVFRLGLLIYSVLRIGYFKKSSNATKRYEIVHKHLDSNDGEWYWDIINVNDKDSRHKKIGNSEPFITSGLYLIVNKVNLYEINTPYQSFDETENTIVEHFINHYFKKNFKLEDFFVEKEDPTIHISNLIVNIYIHFESYKIYNKVATHILEWLLINKKIESYYHLGTLNKMNSKKFHYQIKESAEKNFIPLGQLVVNFYNYQTKNN